MDGNNVPFLGEQGEESKQLHVYLALTAVLT